MYIDQENEQQYVECQYLVYIKSTRMCGQVNNDKLLTYEHQACVNEASFQKKIFFVDHKSKVLFFDQTSLLA